MSDDGSRGPDEPAQAAFDARSRAHDRDASVFERFFPGPSPRDPRVAARLENLARTAEARQKARGRQPGQRQQGAQQSPAQGATAQQTAPAVRAKDVESMMEALHEQTDVIRALLDADIAIRDDARATAQNSRTFAIAGIAIAFFTLLATVVTVVAAFVHG